MRIVSYFDEQAQAKERKQLPLSMATNRYTKKAAKDAKTKRKWDRVKSAIGFK
jgi:hypothetical protein